MSATDELRRMLSERGVMYDTRDGIAIRNTYWEDGHGRRWGYTEDVGDSGMTDPMLFLVAGQLTFTPEQAIAATLGAGECEFVGDAKRPPKCSACGWQTSIYDCEWLEDGEYEYDGRFCKQCGRKVKR